MSDKDDVSFGFNPKPFLQGLDQLNKGMGNVANVTKGVAAGMKNAMMATAAKIATVALAVKGLVGLAKSALGYMPEVGKSFEIAKDIFMKNLLWPLRQVIAPMLQKMLNWVRDNRTMFVQWGVVIANVFKVGVSMAKSLFDILVKVADAFKPIFSKLFGGSLQNGMNLLVGKLAILTAYIGMALQPIVDLLAGIVTKIVDSGIIDTIFKLASAIGGVAWQAFTGFLSGLSDSGLFDSVLKNLKGLGDAFTSMFNSWTDKKNGATVASVFETIGKAVGELGKFFGHLTEAFGKGLLDNLTGLMVPLQKIADIILGLFKGANGQSDFLGKLFGGLGAALGAGLMTAVQVLALSLDTIVTGITGLAKLGPVLSDIFGGKWDNLGKSWGEVSKTFDGLNQRNGESAGQISGQWQGIFSPPAAKVKDGVVQNGVATGTDPNDVIVAHKGVVSVNKGGSGAPGGVWNFNVTVTDGNARAAGVSFAGGLFDTIRRQTVMEGR